MRNEVGESRGFGFVSFETPDQASAAMRAMNGAILQGKPIIVRFHETKPPRQGRTPESQMPVPGSYYQVISCFIVPLFIRLMRILGCGLRNPELIAL